MRRLTRESILPEIQFRLWQTSSRIYMLVDKLFLFPLDYAWEDEHWGISLYIDSIFKETWYSFRSVTDDRMIWRPLDYHIVHTKHPSWLFHGISSLTNSLLKRDVHPNGSNALRRIECFDIFSLSDEEIVGLLHKQREKRNVCVFIVEVCWSYLFHQSESIRRLI